MLEHWARSWSRFQHRGLIRRAVNEIRDGDAYVKAAEAASKIGPARVAEHQYQENDGFYLNR